MDNFADPEPLQDALTPQEPAPGAQTSSASATGDEFNGNKKAKRKVGNCVLSRPTSYWYTFIYNSTEVCLHI